MSLERTGSIDSASSWGDEYGGGIVNPAGSSFPPEPDDEITVERDDTNDNNEPSTFPSHQEISFGYSVSWCCMKVLYKTAYKIRRLWGTCQTEDTKNNKDIILRLMLRELAIYVVFLIILCFVGFGMTSSATYYFTNSISTTFIDTPIDPNDSSLTFRNLKSSYEWYQFALGPLLDGLYSRTKFGFNFSNGDLNLRLRNQYGKKSNDPNTNVSSPPQMFLENQLYGLPRLRLLKVRNDSCLVHRDFQPYVSVCFGPYGADVEDKRKYGPANLDAWFYRTSDQLGSSSNNYPGIVSSYGGGGFVQDLNTTYHYSKIAIEQLQRFDWITPGATRAVLVDFTLYNPNVNLFCIIRLMTEFPSSGGLVTSWNFRTVKLLRYSTSRDYAILGLECILIVFLIYYSIEEGIEIRRLGMRYFKSFFNLIDIVIVAFMFCVMVLNIHRSVEVGRTFVPGGNHDDRKDPPVDLNVSNSTGTTPSSEATTNETVMCNKYVDLDKMGELQSTLDIMMAVLLFFGWLKLFKFIGFNRTLSQLSMTMGACLTDILAFTFIFVLVYLSFGHLGYFLFGSVLREFSTLEGALFTQFRILLGDYKLDDLVLVNHVLGPAYFMLLVFVLLFILANMFLAIINDAYSDVKIELSRKKSDLELLDYIKRGYQKLMDKLNWRRDHHNIEVTENATAKKRSFCAVGNADDGIGNGRQKNSKNRKEYGRRKPCDNDSFDDSDEDSSTYGERIGRQGGRGLARSLGRSRNEGASKGNRGVSHEEFSLLQRRVDRMEHSIGSVVSKIDAILVKLEGLERMRTSRKDPMTRLLDSVTESEGVPEECRHMREEAWDDYSGIDPSPTSSNSSGRHLSNNVGMETNGSVPS